MSSKNKNENNIIKKQSTESLLNKNKDSKKKDNAKQSKDTLPLLIKIIFCKFKNKYCHMPEQYEMNIIEYIIYNFIIFFI